MNLQFAILGMLSISPMNGYYLKKIFDKSVNYFWTASLSQIYRELNTLEKKEYVSSSIQEQDDRPDKRIYTLTPAGSAAFMAWLTHFPQDMSSAKRDEFSLRIFFGARLGKTELKKQFEQFISERKKTIQTMAEDKKEITEITKVMNAKTSQDEMCMRFIIRRAQLTNDLLVQWAEDCIQELDLLAESSGE
jgi:PadR family transcriptional regulator AphA